MQLYLTKNSLMRIVHTTHTKSELPLDNNGHEDPHSEQQEQEDDKL